MQTGRIMWISQRDGNGVILADVDGYAIEFYFDTSVFKDFHQAKRKDTVSFECRVLNKVNCAYEVRLNP